MICCLTYVYTDEIIVTIKIINMSITPKVSSLENPSLSLRTLCFLEAGIRSHHIYIWVLIQCRFGRLVTSWVWIQVFSVSALDSYTKHLVWISCAMRMVEMSKHNVPKRKATMEFNVCLFQQTHWLVLCRLWKLLLFREGLGSCFRLGVREISPQMGHSSSDHNTPTTTKPNRPTQPFR